MIKYLFSSTKEVTTVKRSVSRFLSAYVIMSLYYVSVSRFLSAYVIMSLYYVSVSRFLSAYCITWFSLCTII